MLLSVTLYQLLLLLLISTLQNAGAQQPTCGCDIQGQSSVLPKPDPRTGLYEGDMMLTGRNLLQLLGLRNTVTNLWPGGVLYYTVPFGHEDQVDSALQKLQAATDNCIRFEKRTTQEAYVEVFSGAGCYSYVGRVGRRQPLSLRMDGCYREYIIQHEFLHALGFYHEQSRSDRDDFVDIKWQNIWSTTCYNFFKQGALLNDFPAYDYKSIMHYTSYSFSCNQQRSIATKDGQDVGGTALTSLDILKIKKLYGCA